MEKSLELDVFCGFVTILAFIGTLGNILILFVYFKRRDRRATNVFIRTLAALDLIVCVVVMPYTVVYEYKVVYSQFACKLFELARHFNIGMSNLTLAAVAAERYVAICKPTFSVLLVYVQRGVLVMILMSIIFSLPSMWVFAVVSAEHPLQLSTTATRENTSFTYPQLPLRNLSDLPEEVKTYCKFTTSILGSLNTLIYQGFQMVMWVFLTVVIIILYGLIYIAVWKRDRTRNRARVTPSVWMVAQADANQIANNGTRKESFRKEVIRPDTFSSQLRENTQPNMVPMENSEMSRSNTVDVRNNSIQAPQILLEKQVERRINAHRKTGTMLFLSTVLYIVTWMPFFLDVFGATDSLVSRHTFFISNASNPIIYGIVNKQVRTAMYSILRGKKVRA